MAIQRGLLKFTMSLFDLTTVLCESIKKKKINDLVPASVF